MCYQILYSSEFSDVVFHNNKARRRGGAIYVDKISSDFVCPLDLLLAANPTAKVGNGFAVIGTYTSCVDNTNFNLSAAHLRCFYIKVYLSSLVKILFSA